MHVLAHGYAAVATIYAGILAQGGQVVPGGEVGPTTGTGQTGLDNLARTFDTWITWGGGIVGIIAAFVMMGGFFMIGTALGSSRQIETGKSTIKYAGICIVGVLLCKAIAQAVVNGVGA